MKIEIESVTNGYIITIPTECEDGIEKKIVLQEQENVFDDNRKEEFICFSELVAHLQDLFGVNSSKHYTIGYVNGVCSEHLRWNFLQEMEKSLDNPKNSYDD